MPWETRIHLELPIIETRYSGLLTPEELTEAARETLALVRAHGRTLLLGDCTDLKGGHSIVDLYGLVDIIKASGSVTDLKEAVLVPSLPDPVDKVRFWETTCYNRGLYVRVFEDRQAAIDWLVK